MTFYNISDFASVYMEELIRLNLSLDLGDETWQRLNATAYALLEEEKDPGGSLYVRVPIIVMYGLIFLAGVVGNVSTCIVIIQNRCMHTATNYYLFSLAISDLILLLSGLPPEVLRVWNPDRYLLGEVSCVLLGLASEASANATVLTITAFTVERYIAICHPFLSHTMSELSRVVKFIIIIWVLALCLAIPQAIQYGVVYTQQESTCTVKWEMVEHAFEISGFVFFVGPMTMITVLYILIAIKLRTSRVLHSAKRGSSNSTTVGSAMSYRASVSQSRAIKMLVAVAVSFFLCWAPFHSQRLLAVYGDTEEPSPTLWQIYLLLTDISGVLYFLSTAINPFLYNIMSNKFRNAFKTTIAYRCCGRNHHIRKTTKCGGKGRSPPANSKRNRIPSTNTHLTTLTCVCRQSDGQRGSVPQYKRSVSDTLIRTNACDKCLGRKDDTTAKGNSCQYKAIKSKLKKGTMAMFNVKENRVSIVEHMCEERVEGHRLEDGRDSSDSSKTSISNSSLQDLQDEEYTGSQLATFMERVNKEIII